MGVAQASEAGSISCGRQRGARIAGLDRSSLVPTINAGAAYLLLFLAPARDRAAAAYKFYASLTIISCFLAFAPAAGHKFGTD